MTKYKCQSHVMQKCEVGATCDGIYNGDDCRCALDNQKIMPPTERDEYKTLHAITADIPLDRLKAICAAEHDGRCVVLPCKVWDLKNMYGELTTPTGDEAETYTTGYRGGHRNGQAELIAYLLQIPTCTREAAEAALQEGAK